MVERELTIKFIGRDQGLNATSRKNAEGVQMLGSAALKTKAELEQLQQGTQELAVLGGAVTAGFGGLAALSFSNFSQFEQFEAALGNAFQDVGRAQDELERVSDFGAQTSFQIDALTQSFIQLVNRGFVPTNRELTNIGDLAASQSKSFDQLVEAILDAQTGEFERLKEFGILARSAGDEVTLSFRGVNQTVEKTPEAIREALIGFGQLEGVAGSLAAQSETAAGALSNFQDSLLQGSVVAGEFIAQGLEPLLRGATSLVNGFLELPGPIQASLVGITGFGAALTGAITLIATFEALQVKSRAATALNTGAILVNSTAKQAATAIEVAYGVAKAVSTASLSKENLLLAANVVASKAAAIAKQLLTASSGQAAAASVALAGKLGVVAAKAALLTAAISVVAELFKRSEGAQFAADLDAATRELERQRGALESNNQALGEGRRTLLRYQQVLADSGPIEVIRTALTDLQASLTDGRDSLDEFGQSFQVFGLEIGQVTAAQRGNQIAAIALSEDIERFGKTVDETTKILAEYGQIGESTQLPVDEVEEFTTAIAAQAAALEEEIQLLEAQKGFSEETDATLQREIDIRKQIIGQLEEKVAAQGGDISAVENAVRATQELSVVLDELSDKYDRLESTANLETTEALANIAQRQADGIISAQEAEQERLNVEQEALSEQLQRDRELLNELLAQRGTREGEEAVQLDDEILDQQTRVAEGEKQLAEERIKQQEELTETAEEEEQKRIDALKEAEEEKLKAIDEATQEAIDLAVENEQERNIKLAELRRDNQITETEANAATAEASTERIRKELQAEDKKLKDIRRLSTLSAAEQAQQRQKVNDLTLKLIESEIAAEEALREVIEERIEEQLDAIRNATEREVIALTQVQNALDAVNQSFERQNSLLDVRRNALQAQEQSLQGAFDIAIDLAANDQERSRLEREAANARVVAAERAAAIEERIIQLKLQQQAVQNEIDQSRARAELAQQQLATAEAAGALQNLREDPAASETAIARAEAAVAASQAAEVALGQQLAGLETAGRLLEETAAIELSATRASGREQVLQARRDRLDVLPEGRERDREAASIRTDANALIREQQAAAQGNFDQLVRNFDQRLAENTSAFQQIQSQISRDTQLTNGRRLIQTQPLTAEQLTTVAPQQTGVLQALEEGFAKIAADTRENGPVVLNQNNSLSVDARDTQPRDVSQEILNELDTVLTEASRKIR